MHYYRISVEIRTNITKANINRTNKQKCILCRSSNISRGPVSQESIKFTATHVVKMTELLITLLLPEPRPMPSAPPLKNSVGVHSTPLPSPPPLGRPRANHGRCHHHRHSDGRGLTTAAGSAPDTTRQAMTGDSAPAHAAQDPNACETAATGIPADWRPPAPNTKQ